MSALHLLSLSDEVCDDCSLHGFCHDRLPRWWRVRGYVCGLLGRRRRKTIVRSSQERGERFQRTKSDGDVANWPCPRQTGGVRGKKSVGRAPPSSHVPRISCSVPSGAIDCLPQDTPSASSPALRSPVLPNSAQSHLPRQTRPTYRVETTAYFTKRPWPPPRSDIQKQLAPSNAL